MSMRHAARGRNAGLHAFPAGVGADSAMFMLLRVTLAFLSAQTAGGSASIQHPPEDFLVGTGPARRDASGHVADIGAIEIEPDTLPQILDHLLRKTGIRAGGACLSAGIALLDTVNEHVVRPAAHVRMRADHFVDLHGGASLRLLEFPT
jgi:hypothetical protein